MSVSIKFLICLRCVLFVFFCAKYKIFPWCHYPSDMDWGEVAEMWTAAANTVLWYSKKKEEEETKQYVSTTHILVHFELNHTSPCAAFMLQIEYLQGLFYAFSHTSMHVYISHAELLVLLHYCLLLSYLSLVGNSTGHCNDPGKTIQKWSESTFFPLPLSLPLLTAER